MKGSFPIEKEHVAHSSIDKTPSCSFISSGKSEWLSSSDTSYVQNHSYSMYNLSIKIQKSKIIDHSLPASIQYFGII